MAEYDSVLTDYLAKKDAGLRVDQEEIIGAYPEHAMRLRSFFENEQGLNRLLSACGANRLAPESPHEGAIIGDFRICREIGRGGIWVVYHAEQCSLSRDVALKVLHVSATLDAEKIARFMSEVEVVAGLNHDHIVPVYSVGQHSGARFFAMKLIDGRPLSQLIGADSDIVTGTTARITADTTQTNAANARANVSAMDGFDRKTKSFRTIASAIAKIADALHYVHELGIVHRDVKPSNILIDRSGKPWLTDFGLAYIDRDESLTATGALLGTLSYMSPEQAMGGRIVDRRTDIYSLGVVLYELLTGEAPFRGERGMVLHRVINDEPTAPRVLDSSVPRDLETICLKCIQKSADARYATAHELSLDLRRYLDGKPIHARRVGPVERLCRWTYRNRVVSTAASIIAFLAIFLIALSLRHNVVVSRLNEDLRETLRRSESLRKDPESARRVAGGMNEQSHVEAYASGMPQPIGAWHRGFRYDGNRSLEEQTPHFDDVDHHGFESSMTRPLNRNPAVVELLGHDGPVNDLAAFASGTRLASVGDDATIRIWNLETNQQEFVLRDSRLSSQANANTASFASNDRYLAVAVAPDGRTLATGGLVLSLWDVAERQFIYDLETFPEQILEIAYSSDGAHIAVHAGDQAHLLELNSRESRHVASSRDSRGMAFSPRETNFNVPVSESDDGAVRGIRSWKRSPWERKNDLPFPNLVDFEVSLEAQSIAAASKQGSVCLLDVKTYRFKSALPPRASEIRDIAFSDDGESLAIAYSDGMLGFAHRSRIQERLWFGSTETDDTTRFFAGHDGEANTVRFIDNSRFVTCGDDGAIRVWNAL